MLYRVMTTDMFDNASELLCREYRDVLEKYRAHAEELRLRMGQPPSVVISGSETVFSEAPVTEEMLAKLAVKATSSSMHTSIDLIRRGFLSYKGVRIGLCGEVNMQDGVFYGFRSYTSVCIRIPREIKGAGSRFIEKVNNSTLIISPPGVGKTSLLRDAVRLLSDTGVRMTLIDERGEISAGGAFDVGKCTDVISLCDKKTAASLVLRTMSPQYIALDEITTPEDIALISDMAGCGAKIIATAHAESIEGMKKRRLYRELLELGIFDVIIQIRLTGSGRAYSAVRL